MRIKYVGQTSAEVLIRDIYTPAFRTWQPGEIKDVPDDLVISVAGPEGAEDGNAVAAILNCGENFVDADTLVNPLFRCASCGDRAMNDFFVPHPDKPPIEYANEAGDRVCVPCFLFGHPKYEAYHTHGGHSLPRAFVAKLKALRDAAHVPEPEAEASVAAVPDPAPSIAVEPTRAYALAGDEEYSHE